MKRTLVLLVLICCPILLSAQTHGRQQGTIIRMRMTDCLGPQHAFITAMSGGGARTEPGALCPEYVLMGDTVVYVIIGKSSEQLLPLAEVTRFRFHKNEMLIRVDDAAKESRFHIKAMALRPEMGSQSADRRGRNDGRRTASSRGGCNDGHTAVDLESQVWSSLEVAWRAPRKR